MMVSDHDKRAGKREFCENTMFFDTWECSEVLICSSSST